MQPVNFVFSLVLGILFMCVAILNLPALNPANRASDVATWRFQLVYTGNFFFSGVMLFLMAVIYTQPVTLIDALVSRMLIVEVAIEVPLIILLITTNHARKRRRSQDASR